MARPGRSRAGEGRSGRCGWAPRLSPRSRGAGAHRAFAAGDSRRFDRCGSRRSRRHRAGRGRGRGGAPGRRSGRRSRGRSVGGRPRWRGATSARIAYCDSQFSSRRIAGPACGVSRVKETPSGCVFQESDGPVRGAIRPERRSLQTGPAAISRTRRTRPRGPRRRGTSERALEPVRLAVEGDERADRRPRRRPRRPRAAANTRSIGWPMTSPSSTSTGRHEQRDLEARAERHRHRELHLVLVGELDGDEVLGEVADRRDEDHADEELGQAERLDERLDRADEDLRQHRQQHRPPRAARRPRPGRSSAGPPWPSLGSWPPSVSAGFVNWNTSDSDVADDQQRARRARTPRRRLPCARRRGRRGEHGRDEQPDRGQHEQRGVRARDLLAEALDARCCRPPTSTLAPRTSSRLPMIEPVSDRLDDVDQAGLQREERDDQLGDVAERRVEDAADLRAR